METYLKLLILYFSSGEHLVNGFIIRHFVFILHNATTQKSIIIINVYHC